MCPPNFEVENDSEKILTTSRENISDRIFLYEEPNESRVQILDDEERLEMLQYHEPNESRLQILDDEERLEMLQYHDDINDENDINIDSYVPQNTASDNNNEYFINPSANSRTERWHRRSSHHHSRRMQRRKDRSRMYKKLKKVYKLLHKTIKGVYQIRSLMNQHVELVRNLQQ
ncbi:hypothetical protein FF38_00578 [Lucilia cuprina]|uniref:Uncharacterized protein n=1 Tax=Lucilia cuprina TaxID=7375 RepID=A0A0L0BN00_LUCCU|nr:hypothetical protein FF38_00578 [Lucilia cuprina]